MLESTQSKVIAAVAGGILIGKFLRPKFDRVFFRTCTLCGEPLSVSRQIFKWTHNPGLTYILNSHLFL